MYFPDYALRSLLRRDPCIRALVAKQYDGPLSDLFTSEGRFMLRRLVLRVLNNIERSSQLA